MQRKALAILIGLAVVAASIPSQNALADESARVRQTKKKVRHVRPDVIPCDRCGVPITCPDGLCASLYGGYGPYGGYPYWSRYGDQGWGFSYQGWGFR